MNRTPGCGSVEGFDRFFLVTGVSSGIGYAVARRLLLSGLSVLGIGRRKMSRDDLLPDLASLDGNQRIGRFQWFPLDLSDLNALTPGVKSVLREGERQFNCTLAGAVLCHGYGDFGALEQFSADRIQALVNTNLTSHMLISRLVLPILKTQKAGDMIFIGSESALQGGKKGAIYCATKFALRGFAQSLRDECASAGVRIGLVNPGMVDTPFFDALDFTPGESEDNYLQADTVAQAVLSMLFMPKGTVVDEMNVSPLKTVIRNK